MTIELYNDGHHKCFSYEDIVGGHGVQSNQFLIVHGAHAALIDPGGDLTYSNLYEHLSQEIMVKELDLVIASNQDPTAPLTNLLELGHLKTTEWAMSTIETLIGQLNGAAWQAVNVAEPFATGRA